MSACSFDCKTRNTLIGCLADCCCRWCNSTSPFCTNLKSHDCINEIQIAECTGNTLFLIIFIIISLLIIIAAIFFICVYKKYIANRLGYTAIRDNL